MSKLLSDGETEERRIDMDHNEPSVRRLLDLRDRLENKKLRAIKRLDMAKRLVAEIDRDLESVSRSLELLGGNGKSKSDPYNNVNPSDLANKSPIQCCVLIAKRNGNLLKMTPARNLMIEAGVLRSKTASSVLFTTVRRSKLFERVPDERGHYRYVAEKSAESTAENLGEMAGLAVDRVAAFTAGVNKGFFGKM